LIASIAVGLGLAGVPPPVPIAPAETIGLSTPGLKAYGQALQGLVDEGRLAGVSTLVARHGKVAMMEAFGYQDLEARKPLTRDTIFRIASMTKPIVGAAMMMLYEQGKWTLDDPVAKHIPEFKDLMVAGPNGPVPQAHPMTMRELMSHTAGFDVNGGYTKLGIPDNTKPLQAMIDALARLPLPAQPGSDWRYGPSVNIQGYIVEKLSKQPLDEFLRARIFQPLQMKDTGFWVDASRQARLATLYTYGNDLEVIRAPEQREPVTRPVFLSGSGGLLSTLGDYWRFAQAMLNGGELEGARILKRETVQLMRTNVLNEGVMVDLYGPKEDGIGFGLDFALVMDPAKANTPRGRNTFYWGGAFGTWFWIDPTNDLIVVGMIQNVDGSLPTGKTPPLRSLSPKMVYASLTDSTR
jgi:CubicO group peptidase (beta-lactamase class C family)